MSGVVGWEWESAGMGMGVFWREGSLGWESSGGASVSEGMRIGVRVRLDQGMPQARLKRRRIRGGGTSASESEGKNRQPITEIKMGVEARVRGCG